jgi:hypothetical protein
MPEIVSYSLRKVSFFITFAGTSPKRIHFGNSSAVDELSLKNRLLWMN